MSDESGAQEATGLEAAEVRPAAEPARKGNGEIASATNEAAPVSEAPAEAEPEVPVTAEPPADAAVAAETPETTEKAPAAEASPGKSPSKKKQPARPRRPRNAGLFRAFRSGFPIEAEVERVIKGGYELKVGGARGFCPHSQMDVIRVEDPEQHVGQSYKFRVTQIRRGGDDVVLSRRAELEGDRLDAAKAVRATLVEGSVMQGRVSGTAAFGAFVDLGAGVRGLVHMSELSHSRVNKIEDAVKIGETVAVKILKLDEKRGRISLSIRQATPDPWAGVKEKFKPGEIYPGTITRLADFGVFVELADQVEGLAPASEFPPCRTGWRERLTVGAGLDWMVLSLDPRQRRISVMPPFEGAVFSPDVPEVGATLKGHVQRVESFGVFVWLGPGRVGLIPNVLTGVPRGGDVAGRFPIEEEVEVEVTEIGEGGRRIRLADKRALAERAAAAESRRRKPAAAHAERPRAAQKKPARPEAKPDGKPEEVFGTSLADKLKAALGR